MSDRPLTHPDPRLERRRQALLSLARCANESPLTFRERGELEALDEQARAARQAPAPLQRGEAVSRAAAVFARLAREGVRPLDDVGWMNPEDKAAVVGPIADAIQAASAGLAGERCPHPAADIGEGEGGRRECRLCGDGLAPAGGGA